MSDLIDRQELKDAVKRYAGEPIKAKDKKCQAICLDMLGTIDSQPTASPWHRVEEPPKGSGAFAACCVYDGKIYWFKAIYFDGKWLREMDGVELPVNYWMEIPQPPQEDMDGERREG